MRTINIEHSGINYELNVEAWIKIVDNGLGIFDWGSHHDYQPELQEFKIEHCKHWLENGDEVWTDDTDFLYELVETYIVEHMDQFQDE
jgi:hypothetical protein